MEGNDGSEGSSALKVYVGQLERGEEGVGEGEKGEGGERQMECTEGREDIEKVHYSHTNLHYIYCVDTMYIYVRLHECFLC